jgi:sugar O-acyltransferase (sialic acid O-acetyltransferase NeuD family)
MKVKNNILGIFGAGGFAKEVMPIVQNQIKKTSENLSMEIHNIFFVTKNKTQEHVNGHRVITESEFFSLECDKKFFNVAISDPSKRSEIVNRSISEECVPLSIKAETSIQKYNVNIEDGFIICDNSVLTSNISIGKFVHINVGSLISHDCEIGSFVTISPHVQILGNVIIRDYVFIGAGAIVKNGTPDSPTVIEKGAVIGMGAVVTKNVREFDVVAGVPARSQTSKLFM